MESSVCASPGCGKPATLQCPTCLKLKLEPTFFCSQDCFKGSWSVHKAVHAPAPTVAPYFENYEFAGPLRPGVLSPIRTVPAHIKRPDYAETGEPLQERAMRGSTTIDCKNAKQIELMKESCQIARDVLDLAGRAAKPGVTTDELDRIVHEYIISKDAYPSPLNYRGFPKSCCTSVNEVICHGIPDSRPLEEGDILNIDISVYKNGYHSDVNEMFLIGEVDPKYRKLVQVTREALDKAIAYCKPGAMYREVGNIISAHVNPHGYSVVRSFCGHGVGELFHCTPNVPHYGKNKAVGTMKVGHTFTIEPMINEGTFNDVTWPDQWTVTTKDGKRSAQFEETLLITPTGVEILTAKKA